MTTLHTYLPQDRLRALANGESLPTRATGSALFADISGFTPLTEALRDSLGTRRGAEELTKHLDAVYTALINEVEKYGGSVISFSGDAVTCWFDDSKGPAAPRSAACAFGLQQVMQAFKSTSLPNGTTTALELKVAVASGSARRFVVGDPNIHCIDTLAGATVERTAAGEHLAQRGDVLLDEAMVNALNPSLVIREWRADSGSGERFAVAASYSETIQPVSPAPVPELSTEQLRRWVHKSQVSREQSFPTEFRPCAVLFVRFVGINYAADDAETQLDAFVKQMQVIASRYEGTLLELTIGDKGSYVYINFGGHEDDARRAVKAALELRERSALQLQMGITQGVVRVGAYGGRTRRTYGALGDEVNLSARLMQTAAINEILISKSVQKTVANDFTFEPRPALLVKGKAELLPVFAVTGERQQRAIRLQEPTYALPMVGRQDELQTINDKLGLVLQGQSQIISIVAEAGMGKSRLVAEVIRAARRKGFACYGGACQSDSIHTPYHVWKSIWGAFFDIDPAAAPQKQTRFLEDGIKSRAPSRVETLPLLGKLLGLNIPDNEFTQTLEPKIRQSALHALLEDCLKAATQVEPTLIVIEDLHWIDALSRDLLEELAKALAHHPVCFVLAYRPPNMERERLQGSALRLESFPAFTKIELNELNTAECEQTIRAKLEQLYPDKFAPGDAVPSVLLDKLMTRAQGNPFYLEELINFLRDRGLDPREPSSLEKIELPDSLHALILSRIDQLTEREKTTLRVASIVGRLFRTDWLMGYYPELGELPQVKAALEALRSLDITPLDSPEPELAYLFKHIVTHEVTYESLPFATREKLHEQLGLYLESANLDEPPLEILAFHYGRSENTEKQREYLRKAGAAAQKTFANEAALAYYGQLLPLLNTPAEKIEIYMLRGSVLELMGAWERTETDYRAALELAEREQSAQDIASAQFALGKLCRQRGDYDAALTWLAQARTGRSALNDRIGMALALIETGAVFWRKGGNAQARETLGEGLALVREADNKAGMALALNYLGNVANNQSDFVAAQALHQESLALRRELGDKAGVSASLNNLGNTANNQGDNARARALHEESLALKREMGDKSGIAISLGNLGGVTVAQGDYAAARALHAESLALKREMGNKSGIASSLTNLGSVALALGEYPEAKILLEEGLAIFRETDDEWGMAGSLNYLGSVALTQNDYPAAQKMFEESLALCQEMDEKSFMAYALLGLGLVGVARNEPEARQHIIASLHLRQETGEQLQLTSSLVGMAGLILQSGDVTRVVQLLGAVDSAFKALHVVVELDILHFHTQTLAAARAMLSESAFQDAWKAGEKLSLEDAVDLALGD